MKRSDSLAGIMPPTSRIEGSALPSGRPSTRALWLPRFVPSSINIMKSRSRYVRRDRHDWCFHWPFLMNRVHLLGNATDIDD